jgi:hydrogenase maturation protease
MKAKPSPRVIIIGIGNEYRGDDAVGLLAARRLWDLAPTKVTILENEGDGAQLMEAWTGADLVFVVDAVCSGAAPGTAHRFEAKVSPLPASIFRHSTHAFGLAEAIELARALRQLPAQLVVYGIEGRDFEAGVQLSGEVREALDRVVKHILKVLNATVERPPE